MKSALLWVSCCVLLISGVQPLTAQRPPVEAPVPERPEHSPSNDDYPGRPVTGWPKVLLFIDHHPLSERGDRYQATLFDPFMDRPAEGWLKLRYTRELLPVLNLLDIHENDILPLGGHLYWIRSISRKNGMQTERVNSAAPPDEPPSSLQIQKPSLTAVTTLGHVYLPPEEFGYPKLQDYYVKPPSGDYWRRFSWVKTNDVTPKPRVFVQEVLPANDGAQQPRAKIALDDRWAGRRELPPTYAVGDVVPIGTKGGGLKITRIQPAIPDLWVCGQSEKGEPKKFQGNLRGWVEFEIVPVNTAAEE